MKRLIFAAIAIFFAGSASGQKISVSPFISFSSEKTSGSLNDNFGNGISLAFDWTKYVTSKFQIQSTGFWSLNGQTDRIIRLRTASGQISVYQDVENKPKWFFRPEAGLLVGVGTPIGGGEQVSRARQDYKVLKHPYFFGVTLGAGEGFKISPRFSILGYIRLEGTVGRMTNRLAENENWSPNSNFLGGAAVFYNFSKD